MDQKQILQVLKELKSAPKKRNFDQSYDLIINLKNLDLKKSEQQLDYPATLHYADGKKKKICAFVGPELLQQAQQSCDLALTADQFPEYTDKKSIKKLAKEFDFFLAQATIMPKVALQFGKVLGPRGKMPNPKLGCVVPPNANLKPLYDKLQKTVGIKAKTQPLIQVRVGKESIRDDEVTDNILTIYNSLINRLPSEKNNIRSVYLKLTMGKPVRIDSLKAKSDQKQLGKDTPKAAGRKPDKPSAEEQPPAAKETSKEETAPKRQEPESKEVASQEDKSAAEKQQPKERDTAAKAVEKA